MLRRTRGCFLLAFILLAAATSEAQYKGDHIPGFAGLEAGSQAPPGLYVGYVVWVYPNSTVKDNSGNRITLPGSLTATAEIILVEVVTKCKLFGTNIGASVGLPFIKKPDTVQLAGSEHRFCLHGRVCRCDSRLALQACRSHRRLQPLHTYREILFGPNRQHRPRHLGQ
jgi:hypothetical protein